ncbi:hypothetical protein [Luteolibacter sp. LG18]|uniref:hypothetical protein n=1 Tax=Luteolibacter sp. LG18 TaxID=2819286 RepID=UPI002B2906C1|nr:hypothetical protein llg_39660 [Luteolibacter sp. LG18]
MNLTWFSVNGTTTGEIHANWDFVSGFTPVEPTYPASGGFIASGALVAGPGSSLRHRIRIPAYTGYTYEIYSNPTMETLEWKAVPFSLTQTGTIDRNNDTSSAAVKGFYKVTFRVPSANTGTP